MAEAGPLIKLAIAVGDAREEPVQADARRGRQAGLAGGEYNMQ